MRYLAIVFVVAGFGLAGALWLRSTGSTAGTENIVSTTPPMSALGCERPHYRFGIKTTRESLNHTFVLQNNSAQPLTIDRIQASCGCSSTELNRKQLLPGQHARLKVKADFHSPGSWGVYLMVYTDSAEPPLQLRISGDVLSQVTDLQKEHCLQVGELTIAKSRRFYFRLASQSQLNLQVKSVEPDFLNVSLDSLAGSYFALNIQADEHAELGSFTGRIILVPKTSEAPKIPVSVEGAVCSDLYAVPASLPSHSSAPKVNYVTICSRSGRPFQLVNVRSPEAFRIDVVQPEAAQIRKRVRVTRINPLPLPDDAQIHFSAQNERRFVSIRFR